MRAVRRLNMFKKFLNKSQPYFLIGPALIVLLALAFIPLVYNLALSLFKTSGGDMFGTFVGFDNYVEVFTDDAFWSALTITLTFTVLTVAIELCLGFTIAMLLNYKFLRCKGIFRSLFILPMVCAPVLVGVLWRMLYFPDYGVINYIFHDVLHILPEVVWLGNGTTAFISLMITDIWYTTPLIILILLAGLKSLPDQPYESARLDGASGRQSFMYITLPMMKPFIMVALLLRVMDAVKIFDLPWTMTSGGPGTSTQTLNMLLYVTGFKSGNLNGASALSVIITLIMLLVSSYFIYSTVKNSK